VKDNQMAATVSAEGQVKRIYADAHGCFIRLADPTPNPNPEDGYFQLQRAHDNFSALYALAMCAATNGYPLKIRTVNPITPQSRAVVAYLVIDF
jgi:hypothetical protein